MTKLFQNTIFQIKDEIIFQPPLRKKVSPANMKKKYVEVLQSVFDFYIRSKMDAEDMEYENIMNEL
jgi:hypothetical protein